MSHRNVQIKSVEEVSKDYLWNFRKLEDWRTPLTELDKKAESRLDRFIEKEAHKIKADLAVITSTNESYIRKPATLDSEVTFYQKRYHSKDQKDC